MEDASRVLGEAITLMGGSLSVTGLRHLSAALRYCPNGRKRAPDALRQEMQWQMVMLRGRVTLSHSTMPQRQRPLSTTGVRGETGSEVGSMMADGGKVIWVK